MTETSPTFGDLLRFVLARLKSASIEIPLENEREWQRLFYSLKQDFGKDYQVLQSIRFDWDGPSPRSKQLAEYIQALHWTGNISGSNPSWETLTLSDEIARDWLSELDELPPNFQKLTETAFERAKVAFNA